MERVGRTGGLENARDVAERRKWLGLAVFAAGLAAGATMALRLPALYRSTATVLVEHRQAPETLMPGELEARLQTISEEILSRSRLQALIDRFDLYPDLKRTVSPEAVVAQMRRDIAMESKGVDQGGRGATIAFSLGYRGRDPQVAATVANTLASFYVEEDLKIRERQATGTVQFLKVQLDESKKKIDEQERRMAAFHERYMGELPDQTPVNLAALERLNLQLRVNAEDRIRAMERRDAISARLADADAPVAAAPGEPDALAARLAQLRRELAELRQRYSEKYPDVIRVKAEIAAHEGEAAEARPQARPEPAATPTRAQLRMKEALAAIEGEIAALRTEHDRLQEQIAGYSQRLENAPKREQELQQTSQDYRMTKELYDALLKRYEEAKLAEGTEPGWQRPRFRILDPAVPPREPVAPNRMFLLVGAIVFALVLAAAAVIAAEHLDASFHTVDELRAFTRVPVLVSIRRIVTPADRRRRRRRLWLAAATTAAGLALVVQASSYLARGNYALVSIMAKGRS
jgi:polysaccharide chain length determinant protein (PEP-CTERM system associated)